MTFTCSATSDEAITYKLYKANAQVGSASSTVITIATAADAGEYTCSAETPSVAETSSSGQTVEVIGKFPFWLPEVLFTNFCFISLNNPVFLMSDAQKTSVSRLEHILLLLSKRFLTINKHNINVNDTF